MSDYDRQVAIAIGYHFWHCDTDAQAESNGRDCAIDVAKRLSPAVASPIRPKANGYCRDCDELLPAGRTYFCPACDPEVAP